MAQFELNQRISLMYSNLVVPSIITKRIKVENLDTGTSEIYYDYKHDLIDGKGYSFTDVPESHLMNSYRKALDKVMKEKFS